MLEAFGQRLAELEGHLHGTPTLAAARGVAARLIGEAGVARWGDAELDGIVAPDAERPAVDAEVSLIVADVGVADTGAIGFVHGTGRARAVGLLPTRQIALLHRREIVQSTAQALARFFDGGGARPANVVLVAGPSRTSDVEQRPIRGVHAPRELDVIVYGREEQG